MDSQLLSGRTTTVRKQHQRDRRQAEAERKVTNIARCGGAFVAAVEATRTAMVITDPTVADDPIVYANDAFLKMCGYEREEVLGQDYLFLMDQQASPEVAERVEAAMAARQQITEQVLLYRKDGGRIWMSLFVHPVVEDNRVVQHFACFSDITNRVERESVLHEAKETLDRRVAIRTLRLRKAKQRLEDEIERRRRNEATLQDAVAQGQEDIQFRDFLIREVHHRTKNALQLAVSLLTMQASHSAAPQTRGALEAAAQRLLRVGEVHSRLTYQGEAPDAVDFPSHLRCLCQQMVEALVTTPGQVRVEVAADEEAIWGPDLVVSLGLIVGEAVTNALRHAFPEGRQGRLRVNLQAVGGGRMTLSVGDDGVGLPEGRRDGAFGLGLVTILAKQIKGQVRIESNAGGGTLVAVTFPDPNVLPG